MQGSALRRSFGYVRCSAAPNDAGLPAHQRFTFFFSGSTAASASLRYSFSRRAVSSPQAGASCSKGFFHYRLPCLQQRAAALHNQKLPPALFDLRQMLLHALVFPVGKSAPVSAARVHAALLPAAALPAAARRTPAGCLLQYEPQSLQFPSSAHLTNCSTSGKTPANIKSHKTPP